jgi:hypothetical protein
MSRWNLRYRESLGTLHAQPVAIEVRFGYNPANAAAEIGFQDT